MAFRRLVANDEMTTEDKHPRGYRGPPKLANASYFAFTATPKNKTLETLRRRAPRRTGGEAPPVPQLLMKQAIEEGFILDVLSTTRR